MLVVVGCRITRAGRSRRTLDRCGGGGGGGSGGGVVGDGGEAGLELFDVEVARKHLGAVRAGRRGQRVRVLVAKSDFAEFAISRQTAAHPTDAMQFAKPTLKSRAARDLMKYD
jgi:hypothetical protein